MTHEQTTSPASRRVLVFNQFANPLGSPGGTRHAELFSRMEGWQATVVTAARNLFDRSPMRGLPPGWLAVRTTPYGRSSAARIASWFTWAVGATLRGLRISPAPDLVFASSPQLLAGVAGALSAKRWRVPFVFEVRDLWPDVLAEMGALSSRHPLFLALRHLERWIYRQADLVVCLAPPVARELARRGLDSSRIAVVPNGSDVDAMRPPADRPILKRRLGIPEHCFAVMYAGAHGAANGLHLLLDAAEKVADKDPRIRFVLVGDGPLKSQLVEMSERKRLQNVLFLDPVPKSDMPAVLGAADVGVHVLADVPLFRWGVSPNKVFDYMAAGLPVVTNSPGEVAKMVTESGAGLAASPDGLAEAVIELASLPSEELRAMGRRGRDWLSRTHDRSVLARELRTRLDELVERRSAGRR